MIRNEPRLEKQRHQAGTFTPQVPDLLTAGLAHHRAGNLQLARDSYQIVLTIDPSQADALHLLGVTFLNECPSEAESFIRRAISSRLVRDACAAAWCRALVLSCVVETP